MWCAFLAASALLYLFASLYLAWTQHGEDRATVTTATTSTRTPKCVEDSFAYRVKWVKWWIDDEDLLGNGRGGAN